VLIINPWAVQLCVFPAAKNAPLSLGIIHVDKKKLNRERSQFTTLMQNKITDGSGTDRFSCHFMDMSRMMRVHAMSDIPPPTLGMTLGI